MHALHGKTMCFVWCENFTVLFDLVLCFVILMSVEKGCSLSDETPDWAIGLKPCGLYYEGYTDNLQELLNKHNSSTITTYSVRRSHSCNKQSSRKALVESSVDNKENKQIQVSYYHPIQNNCIIYVANLLCMTK